MIPSRAFQIFLLIWFFGWGILLFKFPVQCYRILSLGREPSSKHLRSAKVVAYIGLFGGSLLLIEIAFGAIH
jgi:peptidoglycan/LPS O-acetylase OafA/YrhL